MSNTRRLSEYGREVIDELKAKARISLESWSQAAYCSKPTLRRFLSHQSIRTDIFISICKAVGLEDWRKVASYEKNSRAFAAFGKVHESMVSDIETLIEHLRKYVLEFEDTKDTSGYLVVSGYYDENNSVMMQLILSELSDRLQEGKYSLYQNDTESMVECGIDSTLRK